MKKKKRIVTASLIVVIILISVIATVVLMLPGSDEAKSSTAKEPLYWQAPMNPDYRSDQPGKSPMGMDLVPVYEDSKEGMVRAIALNFTNKFH